MDKEYINKYTRFRELKNFKVLPLVRNTQVDKNGIMVDEILFNGEVVSEVINGKRVSYPEGKNFVNASSMFYKSVAGVLSNLFPIEFEFRGKKVASIEGVLQGCKYKDIDIQNEVLKYSGMDAYAAGRANNWMADGILYWQGKPMERKGKEYQIFLDELYLSALTNPIYKKALMFTKDKILIHHIGKNSEDETVLTRAEYEIRLNTLRDFAKLKHCVCGKECDCMTR